MSVSAAPLLATEPVPSSSLFASCRNFRFTRWTSLAFSMGVMICGGTIYGFGIFSNALKARMGYTQSQTDHLAFAATVGGYFGFIPGYVYDRWGPRVTVLLGVLVNFLGYFPFYLGAAGHIEAPYWMMIAFCVLWGHAGNYFDCPVMGTAIRNFPSDKGLATGFMKAFYGLSASIITQVYDTFYQDHPMDFLLFLALLGLPGLISSVGLRISQPSPLLTAQETRRIAQKSRRRFVRGYAVLVLLAAYLSAIALINSANKKLFTHDIRLALLGGLMVLLSLVFVIPYNSEKPPRVPFAPPLTPSTSFSVDPAVPVTRAGRAHRRRLTADRNMLAALVADRHDEGLSAATTVPTLSGGDAAALQAGGVGGVGVVGGDAGAFVVSPSSGMITEVVPPTLPVDTTGIPLAEIRRPVVIANVTLLGAFKTLNYWMLSFCILCVIAGGLTVINNIAQIVEALGGSSQDQNVYVSMLSIGNCMGRVLMGYFPDRLASKIPRPFFLSMAIIAMTTAEIMLCFATLDTLYFGCLLLGASYGAHAALIPSVVSEFFGMTNFGLVVNSFIGPSMFGTFVFATALFSRVYEDAISDGSTICRGRECYQATLFSVAALCAVGVVCAVTLAMRNRRHYQSSGSASQATTGLLNAQAADSSAAFLHDAPPPVAYSSSGHHQVPADMDYDDDGNDDNGDHEGNGGAPHTIAVTH